MSKKSPNNFVDNEIREMILELRKATELKEQALIASLRAELKACQDEITLLREVHAAASSAAGGALWLSADDLALVRIGKSVFASELRNLSRRWRNVLAAPHWVRDEFLDNFDIILHKPPAGKGLLVTRLGF